MIHPTYLPFTHNQLASHFLGNAAHQIKYFEDSAKRHKDFFKTNPNVKGVPIATARYARQMEKDERFWTACSLKTVIDDPNCHAILKGLLSQAFSAIPSIGGLGTWDQCLDGDLHLYLEAPAPSPPSYVEWLQQNVATRHIIPYVIDASKRLNARPLEGATNFDAVIVNPSNGFSLLLEAKVLSDISVAVTFDVLRNQLARCIDVMLELDPSRPQAFGKRIPGRSLLLLLTPEVFRKSPHSRLYGRVFEEYKSNPQSLDRDLPHRPGTNWTNVASRIGWITYEDIKFACPSACPWL